MPAPRLSTYEYLRTPETMLPQELVYGVLRDAPAPAPQHQSVLVWMLVALVRHVYDRRLGVLLPSPIDVVLDAERALVVQPDLVFIRADRQQIVTDRVWGPPDLVVEVLSPHPRIGRLDERLDWFARHGVAECWLVHELGRELEVLEFAEGAIGARRAFAANSPIRSVVLPDFQQCLEEILSGR